MIVPPYDACPISAGSKEANGKDWCHRQVVHFL